MAIFCYGGGTSAWTPSGVVALGWMKSTWRRCVTSNERTTTMSVKRTSRARAFVMAGASLAVAGLLAGCTAGGAESSVTEKQNSAEENSASGDTDGIGF